MFEFLHVSSDWNFEIMTISLPIKLPCTLPLCPKKSEIDLAVNSLLKNH